MKLNGLAILLLALLEEKNMHPYEMMTLLRERTEDRLVRLTTGTLYHTIGRLEEEGFISQAGVEREGNRPERTLYALEASGREGLREWVREHLRRIDNTADFRIALAEANTLTRTEVCNLLRERNKMLTQKILDRRALLSAARTQNTPEQYLLEVAREDALNTAEEQWQKKLIERLSAADFPWDTAHNSPHYTSNNKEKS